MVKRRNAKKPQVHTELDVFNAEFMSALNEKFKLRSQLGALMNQLEEMRARHERLVDSIKEYNAANSPRISIGGVPRQPEVRPRQSVALPTALQVARRLQEPVPPPKPQPKPELVPDPHKATQTIQPEPPSLFPDSPIRGLPLIIPEQTGFIEQAKPTNFAEPVSPPPPSKNYPTSKLDKMIPAISFESRYGQAPLSSQSSLTKAASVHDDPDTDIRRQPRPSVINELEDELRHLEQVFKRLNFYGALVIFIIFGCMFMKEMGVVLINKYWSDFWQPEIQLDTETEDALCDAELCPQAIETQPEVETLTAPSVVSGPTTICPCPPELSAGPLKQTIQGYSTRQGPLFEQSILINTKYDCDECNKKFNFGKAKLGII